MRAPVAADIGQLGPGRGPLPVSKESVAIRRLGFRPNFGRTLRHAGDIPEIYPGHFSGHMERKKARFEGGPFIVKRRNYLKIGRGDRIRTCDFYVPNVALYQAELHPDGSRVY